MDVLIEKDQNTYDLEIYEVIKSAFKQDDEAILVEKIKKESSFYISYVAKVEDKVVGHIMISPMLLDSEEVVLALAPVSVLEEYSEHGIGAMLIKKALSDASQNEDYLFITVLGSDHYYNRFGFEAYDSKLFNIPFDIDERFFQVLETQKDNLDGLSGSLTYPEYFNL
ncbi:MAG: N-acetyltransferase [Erysipelotrichales bacterium]